MKQYPESTTKGAEVCSSKGCTSSTSYSTDKNEIQELKRQMVEMMFMMADMAKEKERAESKEDLNKNWSMKRNVTSEQSSLNKQSVLSTIKICINKPDYVDGTKKDFWESTEKMSTKFQKSKMKIKEKDSDMKMFVAQAREAAQQVADLADMVMTLSQNVDPTSYHVQLENRLEEVIKIGGNDGNFIKLDAKELCLVLDLVVPPNFKNIFDHGLTDAFFGQYKYVIDLAPNCQFLQNMRVRFDGSFKEYAMSANLKVFGLPISELFSHLVEKQYLTPRPVKKMPNPSAHSYDPDSTCDFHMEAPGHATKKCRPLMDETKKLVNNGILTEEPVQQWKTKGT
ncbi:hypothetical protein GQ457_18G010490 [Hibiscus cannabinus]